jgi:hypothetical protein
MSNETSNLHFEATVSKRRFVPPSSGLSCATLGRKINAKALGSGNRNKVLTYDAYL